VSQGGEYFSALEGLGFPEVLEAIPFPNSSTQVILRSSIKSTISNVLNLFVQIVRTWKIVFGIIFMCLVFLAHFCFTRMRYMRLAMNALQDDICSQLPPVANYVPVEVLLIEVALVKESVSIAQKEDAQTIWEGQNAIPVLLGHIRTTLDTAHAKFGNIN
jgi:hypothetical protein